MPYWTEVDGKGIELSAGIFKEIHDRLKECNAMCKESFLEEERKYILNKMVIEANVDLLFHVYIFRVKKFGEDISSITVATKSGSNGQAISVAIGYDSRHHFRGICAGECRDPWE